MFDEYRHRRLETPTVGIREVQHGKGGKGLGDRAPTKRGLCGSDTQTLDDDRLAGVEEYDTRGGNVACLALALDALNDSVPFRGAHLLGRRTFDRAGRANERGRQAESGGSSVQKYASFLNANCDLRRAKRHP